MAKPDPRTTFRPTKAQCLVHQPHPWRTRYAMKNVKLCADGSMESTDGKVLVKAYPKEPVEAPVAERLLDAKMLKKAGREVAKDQAISIKETQIHYLVGREGEQRRVSLTADPIPGTRNVLENEVENWPDTGEIIDKAKKTPFDMAATFSVKVMKSVLDALARAGAEAVRFDFDAKDGGSRNLSRFSAQTGDTYIVGVVMPVSSGLKNAWEEVRDR